LETHDHSGKKARENHHRKRIDADRFQMMDDEAKLGRRAECQDESRKEKEKHSPHFGKVAERKAADLA
jgi:hypothetical protein